MDVNCGIVGYELLLRGYIGLLIWEGEGEANTGEKLKGYGDEPGAETLDTEEGEAGAMT